MKNLRTIKRTAYYNSDWNLGSVLSRCEEKNISAESVAKAITKCHKLVKGFTPERMAGALVIIFRLDEGIL